MAQQLVIGVNDRTSNLYRRAPPVAVTTMWPSAACHKHVQYFNR